MANQRRNPEQRPSPEALLEAARREEGRVGRLRIFVGAAAGVGKTYQLLQDELAHTNAPGSRHPKRYLDVEELLSHGIDVYSTVNIQHIESLNDVVAQITHVRVRETVPDSVFDRADAVELVDLTPDELIQRLK